MRDVKHSRSIFPILTNIFSSCIDSYICADLNVSPVTDIYCYIDDYHILLKKQASYCFYDEVLNILGIFGNHGGEE